MNFFERIDPKRAPTSASPDDRLLHIQEQMLQYLLLGASLLGAAAYLIGIISSVQRRAWGALLLYSVAYLAILAITFWRQVPYPARAAVMLLILYGLGLSGLLESGLSGGGRGILIVFAILSVIFLGIRAGITASVLSSLSLALAGWLISSGRLPLPPADSPAANNPAAWMTAALFLFGLSVVAVALIHTLIHTLKKMVVAERRFAREALNGRNRLDVVLQERTRQLELRAAELETIKRLTQDLSTSAAPEDKLLHHAVEIISSQFGFYHAGIFLLDEQNEFAVLKAAAGDAGRAMLERGHRLMSGEVGVVGLVVSQGKAHITDDVEKDPFHFKNPLLPDTRAEMAVPLKIGPVTIGALDVQSEKPGAFTAEDAATLQTIAGQLALTMEKNRLEGQLRQLQTASQEIAADSEQKTWRDHLIATRQKRTYRSGADDSVESSGESQEAARALQTGKVVIGTPLSSPESGTPERVVAVPILLRQQVIGVLDVRVQGDTPAQDWIDLLEATASRMAVALENARLLEAIQVRAEREHMVSGITASVRSSTDIDGILRTAALELGRSLGISEVTVQLRPGK